MGIDESKVKWDSAVSIDESKIKWDDPKAIDESKVQWDDNGDWLSKAKESANDIARGVGHFATLPSRLMEEALNTEPTKMVGSALDAVGANADRVNSMLAQAIRPAYRSFTGGDNTVDKYIKDVQDRIKSYEQKNTETVYKDGQKEEIIKPSYEASSMLTHPLNAVFPSLGKAETLFGAVGHGAGIGTGISAFDSIADNKDMTLKDTVASAGTLAAINAITHGLGKIKTPDTIKEDTQTPTNFDAQSYLDSTKASKASEELGLNDNSNYKTMEEIKAYIAENDKGGQAQADLFEQQMNLWAKAENLRRAEEGKAPVTAEQMANDFILKYEAQPKEVVNENVTTDNLQNHPRFQELMDMRRDVSSKDTQYSQTLVQPRGTDADGNWYGASYDRNFNADFELTKADVKAIESGKATPEQIIKLRNDLGRLENDPMYKQAPMDANEQLAANGELFQFVGAKDGEVKGSYTIDEKLIKLFESHDVSTLNHELGHRFLFTLSAKERGIAEQVFGVKDGKWEVKHHEAFADAYARYIAEGKAPSAGIKAIFEKFTAFMKEILLKLKENNGGKMPPLSKEAKEFFAAVLGNEKARNELMKKYTAKDASSMGEGELFSKAYHGTPHDVDKFDTAKIGTGEGAQAYGYGLYFADSKEVAEFYRTSTMSRDNRIAYDKAVEEIKNLKSLIEEAQSNPKLTSQLPKLKEFLVKAEKTKQELLQSGNLYRVDLKPKEEEYLLWDKPLDEQSLHVKEALQKELDIYRKSEGAKGAYVNNSSGEKLYKEFIYTYGSDKKASERLNELGIKGIKYEDGNSRSRDVNKNHNYVIFKNEDVEITGANGKMFDGTPNELFQKIEYTKENEDFKIRASEKIDDIVKVTKSYAYGKRYAPEKVYRGVSGDGILNNEHGASSEGIGLYTTANKSLAKDYGRVIELDKSNIPSNPLVFRDLNHFEIWHQQIMYNVLGYKRASDFRNITINEIVDVIDKSIDGLQIGEGKKAFWVKYPDINSLIESSPNELFQKRNKEKFDILKFANEVLNKISSDKIEVNEKNIAKYITSIKDMINRGANVKGGEQSKIALQELVLKYDDIYSKNKDRFLKDSIIKTPVYHGTNQEFYEFKPTKGYRGTGIFTRDVVSPAFFFTDDKSVARIFGEPKADELGGQYRLMENYISLKNPIDLTKVTPKVKAVLKKAGFDTDAYFGKGQTKAHNLWASLDEQSVVTELKNMGYDGAIVSEGNKGKSYAVFDASQIKSINNIGTFDESNPNILYQRTDLSVGDETLMESVQRKVQDKFLRVKKLIEAKANINAIADKLNPYLAEELYHGRVQNRLDQFQKDYVEPIIKKISSSKVTIDQVDEYLHARHAIERNRKMEELNGIKDGSGMSDAEAVRILAKYANNTDMLDIAKMVYAMNKDRLKLIYKEGLESADFIKTIDGTYNNYVPLKRVMDSDGNYMSTGKGFDIKGKELKRAHGSNREVESPLLNSILAFNETIIRAEKNEVGKAMINFAEAYPDANLYEVNSLKHVPQYDSNGDVISMNPKYQLANNVLHVKIDGKVKEIVFKDPLLARAFKNLSSEQMGAVMQGAQKLIRYYASINTQYNPEFVISNFERDLQTAMINLPEEVKGSRAIILRDVFSAINGIHKAIYERTPNEWSKLYAEMKAEGGTTGWIEQYNVPDMKKSTEILIRKYEGEVMPKEAFKAALEHIDNINTVIENASRLVVYKMAKESGLSNKRSASIAKNLTVNFNRKGEMGQALNLMYMFFNASIQGTTRTLQAIKHSKTVQGIVGGIVASSTALALYNMSQNEEAYSLIPQYEKDTNLIFMNEDGTYKKVKVPYGYNVFKSLGDIMAEAYNGDLKPEKMPSRILGVAVNAFSPIGTAPTLGQMLTPTIARPAVDLEVNKNFAGNPIQPEKSGFGASSPDSYNYFNSVNPIAKSIAQEANKLTGGNMYKSGMADVSPETIEYLFETATGGVGKFFNRVYKTASGNAETNDIPFVRNFIGETTDKSKQSKVYDIYKRSGEEIIDQKELDRFVKFGREGVSNGSIEPDRFISMVTTIASNQAKLKWADRNDIQSKDDVLNSPSIMMDALQSGVPKSEILSIAKKKKKEDEALLKR